MKLSKTCKLWIAEKKGEDAPQNGDFVIGAYSLSLAKQYINEHAAASKYRLGIYNWKSRKWESLKDGRSVRKIKTHPKIKIENKIEKESEKFKLVALKGADNDFSIALGNLRSILPDVIKGQCLIAQLTKAKFDELKKAGFTDEQALELCKSISLTNFW